MRDIITGQMSSLSSLQAGDLISKRAEVKISEDENVKGYRGVGSGNGLQGIKGIRTQRIRRFLTEEMIVKRKMRILSLVLTALMVTALGGCGSTDNSIDNTAPQNDTITNDQGTEDDLRGDRSRYV